MMMPMFAPRMHPGCFQAITLLEDCFSNDKLALTAELKQEVPIVITVTNAGTTKHSFPGHRDPPNSIIEVFKYQCLIICRSVVQMSALI